MAEENEGFIEDDAIVLEDSEDSTSRRCRYSKIIPFIMEKYNRAEDYRQQDEDVGYVLIVTIVVCMVQMFNLQKQKSLEYLLK